MFCHNSKIPILMLQHDSNSRCFSCQTCTFGGLGLPCGLLRCHCSHCHCLKSLENEMYDCTLNYIFQKDVFIHYNNYCFLNNIIIPRGMFFMSNIIAVIKFYKFSNTQRVSVLSTKYVYLLNKNAQENRLIKNTTKVERTLLVTF